MIKVGSDFSGVGAFNQALIRLNISYEEIFACDMDKYARKTFVLNYGNDSDKKILKDKCYIKIADIFHREFVDKNLLRPTQEELNFAYANCDSIARKFSFYFPWNVYNRKAPTESLDIYMTSPPCQAFSLAGKRHGENNDRGILFYNSHEFIKVNQPRFFIIENVKGLLSDDYGKTFQRWIDFLAGKSINGTQIMFPHEESVPYHVYYKVLNAKDFNIPQNRERVFIIGIRDDADNDFNFPKPEPLTKRLKDVLQDQVDEKYFLSDKILEYFKKHLQHHKEKGNGFGFKPQEINDTHANSLTTKYGSRQSDTYLKIGTWRTHEDGKGFREMDDNVCPTIPARAREDGSGQPVIKVTQLNASTESNGKQPYQHNRVYDINGLMTTLDTDSGRKNVLIQSNTKKGFETLTDEDSVNFSVPTSKTRRGRVGKGVAQTLDTACNQGVLVNEYKGIAVHPNSKKLEFDGFKDTNCPTILATDYKAPKCIEYTNHRIRRLTPYECFMLMDFNPDFKWNVSDSQAYKQAGNSICVGLLARIIEKLKL